MDYYVYCWTHKASGKRYIGKGRASRARAHLRPSARGLLARALRKYGAEAFELRYLATGLEEPLAFYLEQHCIRELPTRSPYGYNLTGGGEGSSGFRHSLESRAKMNRNRSPESFAKTAASNRGRKYSAEVRARVSAGRRNPSAETRAKHVAAATNISPETRKRRSDAAKRVHAARRASGYYDR